MIDATGKKCIIETIELSQKLENYMKVFCSIYKHIGKVKYIRKHRKYCMGSSYYKK